jgi:hypothetical protein
MDSGDYLTHVTTEAGHLPHQEPVKSACGGILLDPVE